MSTPAGRAGDERTLLDYADVIWRRKLEIIAVALAIPLLVFAIASTRPAIHEAVVQVELSQVDLPAILNGGPVSSPESQARDVETQAQLARARPVLQPVARALRTSVGDVHAHTSASAAADANLLDFRGRSRTGGGAARLASEYATAFASFRNRADAARIQSTATAVQSRLSQLVAQGQGLGQVAQGLRNRRAQLENLQTLYNPRASVVGLTGEAIQISPKPLRDTAIAAILGLLAALALAFLLEALSVRTLFAAADTTRAGKPTA